MKKNVSDFRSETGSEKISETEVSGDFGSLPVQAGVSVSELSLTRGGRPVFSNFSLSFEKDRVTAVFGPSGSGKTTLLDCIAGLLAAQSGTVSFYSGKPEAVSYLFQEPRLLPWRTLLQNVSLPLQNRMTRREADERACFFLEKTGLLERRNDFPHRLSGGERQRTALARAFAFPAPVLLMDEAFQSQDIGLKTQLTRLLASLLETEPRTVIMVSHDIHEVFFLADRVLVFSGLPVFVALDRENPKNDPAQVLELENEVIQVFYAALGSNQETVT